MSTHSANRDCAVNMLICVLMLILNVGGIAYVIARGPVDTSVSEEFVVTVLFLLAPFIGGCSAFRFARSSERSVKIIGWLFIVVFALFFFQAVIVDWAQYRNDREMLIH